MERSGIVVLVSLVAALSLATAPVPAADLSDRPAAIGVSGDRTVDAGAGPPNVRAEADASAFVQEGTFDRNRVVLTVREDQSTRWTFRYERTLENDTERESFESFAEEFNENETSLYTRFQRDAEGLAAEGSNVTDREMTAENYSKRAFVTRNPVGNTIGVVEMSFTWTNFAARNGDRLIVGDVFDGGLYIGPDKRLVIVRGPELRLESVDPDPDDRSDPSSLQASNSVTWQGEREFTDRRPRAVFVPEEEATETDDGTGGSDGDGDGDGDGTADGGIGDGIGDSPADPAGSDGFGLWPFALIGLLVVAGGGAVWYVSRSRSEGADGGGFGPVPAISGRSDDDGGIGPEPKSEPTVTDEDLLSDEDRVVSLLRENGGRMKQVKIVDETGWSKSKVSMLLSDMEEEGTISKLRVGRENIISLKGNEPDATRTPFDEEQPNG